MGVILAIESSCDDTSAAVIKDGVILSNVVAGQPVHEAWGGVVPELASRAHHQNIVPVVDKALKDAGIEKKDLDAIGFTRGPGLLGPLLVGTSFAKSMALGLDIPLIEVNHMHAHILAHFIDEPKPKFPFLCLTVSGGHTQIVKVDDPFTMTILGQTRDDAAGEAFDKSAKILGLPYPGGPLIDKYAQEGEVKFELPHPKIPGIDFSFSGLKTAILYFIQNETKKNPNFVEENKADICASIQDIIIKILTGKLKRAANENNIREISIAGGVSANSGLRNRLEELGKKHNWNTYIPQFQYCTDNAAMIAIAAHFKYEKGEFVGQDVTPMARLPFNV